MIQFARTATLILLLCLAALPAGSEGRLEINQVCAFGGGCFPGDTPGFPVQITSQNSYVLTSNIIASSAAQAIDIQVGGVTIDLAGFSIGPCVNVGQLCPTLQVADAIAGPTSNDVTIRNGVIQNFRGSGVVLGRRAHVEGLVILNNDEDGLRVLQNSVVLNNRISFNEGTGASLGAGTIWGGNVLVSNGTDVSGNAYATARNSCSGDPCGLPRGRRFYLSSTQGVCDDAHTLCDEGFRLATGLDLEDPSSLQYDETRGVPRNSVGGQDGWIDPPQCGGLSPSARGGNWAFRSNDNGESFQYRFDYSPFLNRSTPIGSWCVEED